MPAKKMYRKRAAKKPRVVRRRKISNSNVPEYASMSCVRTLTPGATGTTYSFDSVALVDFTRAVQVAQAYQRYRVANIKVTWKPVYDTFSSATSTQKTFLYAMIDKTSSIPDNVTLEGLKQAGARPRALDEKAISISWKPSVLSDNLSSGGGAVASGYKTSPILSTNANPTAPGVWTPSRIAHGGLKWYIEAPGGALSINMEIEVQFQFYKPMFPSLSESPARGLTYAVLDASPDGVEGGTDGITIPLVSH